MTVSSFGSVKRSTCSSSKGPRIRPAAAAALYWVETGAAVAPRDSVMTGRGPSGLPGWFVLRQKWHRERLVKIVTVAEIFETIVLSFAQNPVIDELKNNFAEMTAFRDAPFRKERARHRTVLLERVFPDSL